MAGKPVDVRPTPADGELHSVRATARKTGRARATILVMVLDG